MTKTVDLLKKVYLFKGFPDAELEQIAAIAERRNYSQGDSIFYEGDKATCFYVVSFGSVRVLKKGKEDEQSVNMLGPGMHFGELPFLDGMDRSAKAEAMENCELVEIPYEKLKAVSEKDARLKADLYYAMAHFLAARLRKVTTDLSYSREQNLKHF